MQTKSNIVRNCMALGLVLLLMSGCAYMKNRGNDAMDMAGFGVTVNKNLKPQFRLYANLFVVPLGYGNVDDATLIGWGNRNIGIHDFEAHEWGALLTGEEVYGVGPFNPADFRQVSPVYKKNSPDAPDERPEYKVGMLPLILDKEPRNWAKYVECNKGFHLGWIGLYFPCRPLDMVDFLVGWTTIDILNDDVH